MTDAEAFALIRQYRIRLVWQEEKTIWKAWADCTDDTPYCKQRWRVTDHEAADPADAVEGLIAKCDWMHSKQESLFPEAA